MGRKLAILSLTPEEEVLLIKTIFQFRIEDPEPSLIQLAKMAIELTLPPHKQFGISAKGSLKHILEQVKERYAQFVKAPSESISEILTTNRVEILEPESDSRNKVEELSHQFQNLKTEIFNLKTKYDIKFSNLEEEIRKINLTKESKKLKIGLGGLKSEQFNEVELSVKHRVKLFQIDRNQAHHSVPRNLDYVIIWIEFISHKFNEYLKNYYDDSQIIEVSGGLTTIKTRIHELADNS